LSVPYPLSRTHRARLARAFSAVPRVDLGIECVIEDQMGRAFVDDVASPSVFLIEQAGFFCYLAGPAGSPAGRDLLAGLPRGRMLMPSSPGWFDAAREMYGKRLLSLPRFSFSSEKLDAGALDGLVAALPGRNRLRRLDVPLTRQLVEDPEPVLDLADFESVEDFVQRGIGYALLDGATFIGLAYSSLVCSRGIEVSLYVAPDWRRRGVGTCLAAALLSWCLAHGVDPHWDAANVESCALAHKLGYRSAGTYEVRYLAPEGAR